MDNNGFVYIMSITDYPDIIKIGKSKKDPIIRADQLTRQTGVLSTFKPEWSKEVSSIDIAESVLQFTFRQFHHKKEFFKIDIEFAKQIATSTLDAFFQEDSSTQLRWKLRDKAVAIKEKLKGELISGNEPDISKLEREAIELEKELNKL